MDRPVRPRPLARRAALPSVALALALAAVAAPAPASAADWGKPQRVFTVDSPNTDFAFDINRGDEICADSAGRCPLAAAIQEANASPGLDLIRFALQGPLPVLIGGAPGLGGNYTITDPVIVDGTTQPGYRGRPVIELVGTSGDAFTVTAGNSTIRGLAISGYIDTIAVPGGRAIAISGGGGNVVERNCLGTDTSCTRIRGLGNSRGISVGSSNNRIGGTEPGAGNVVAFSNGRIQDAPPEGANGVGIALVAGTGNAVLGNRLFGNQGLGIDIVGAGGVGVSRNDQGDRDGGPNGTQNVPEISLARSEGAGLRVRGRLSTTAARTFRVELFASTSCDPSGFGEAERLLGARTVRTDSAGNASFEVVLPVAVPAGQSITATATDPLGNSSELSRCRLVTR